MDKQEIFHPDGSLRAVIYTQSSGRQEIHSARGDLLGVYEPETDITTDARGSLVARGNLLASLA